MRRGIAYIVLFLVISGLTTANLRIAGTEAPGCYKWCGYGSTLEFGTRGSSVCEKCVWVRCEWSLPGCSGETFNDACDYPDWCE
jgi:hypothetical protein